jgi:hypothetical protein
VCRSSSSNIATAVGSGTGDPRGLCDGSYASLRNLADYGATLCFNAAENVMDLKRGDPDKRALLLVGNRRGNTIPVKEPVNGREWRTRQVQTFCPRLFSAIRLPDPVLASRSISVPLIRTADRNKANADPPGVSAVACSTGRPPQ